MKGDFRLTFYNKGKLDSYSVSPMIVNGNKSIWVQREDGEGGSFDPEFLYDAIHKHFQEVF